MSRLPIRRSMPCCGRSTMPRATCCRSSTNASRECAHWRSIFWPIISKASSQAGGRWTTARTHGGLCGRDLLPRVAAKFNDVKVPPADVARLAAVPEIYKPISTASYTLSNVQDIFESRLPMDAALVERMHGIITAMAERLLATPPSRQLYLASVHQEGLRNFLDYIEDQKLPVT